MKILVDMNLSPAWCELLRGHGWDAIHWSQVGHFQASDRKIMEWAHSQDHIVFTHDLGFSAILSATGTDGPSVLQIRTRDVLPEKISETVIAALRQFDKPLRDGAIIVVEEARARARVLPLKRNANP